MLRNSGELSPMAEVDVTEAFVREWRESPEWVGTVLREGRTLVYTSLAGKLDATLTALREANEQLARDLEREKRLEMMRKDFIAGVSHELKTPIMLIESCAEGLKYGIARGDDRQEYADVILEEAEKMDAMVRDILELSRLESGAVRLETEALELGAFVRKAAGKFSGQAGAKKVRLTVEVAGDRLMVRADPFRLEQVMANLLNNAIRHAPEGGFVRVGVSRCGGYGVVEVENEGEPIDERELPLIWEKFYRADKSRDRSRAARGWV